MARLTNMAVLALLGLGLAGCGGSTGGGNGGSLRSALASVPDSRAGERFFAWADGKELRKLSGAAGASDLGKSKINQKWLRLTEVALPTVAGEEAQFTAATGIDTYRGDRNITIGVPPQRASRVDGIDGATVLRKFRLLGAREQRGAGRTYLAVADEGQVDVSNPRLGNDVYLALNRVFVNGSSVAFGLTDAPIESILGGGKSLADLPSEAAVAACLGDVFVAEISAPPSGSPGGVSLIGLGVRRPASPDGPVTEVLCEVTNAKDQGSSVAATIGSRVRPNATLPSSTLQVQDRVAQAGVDQLSDAGQHLVRLTLDLVGPARAGFLFLDAGPGGVAFLAGGGGVANPRAGSG